MPDDYTSELLSLRKDPAQMPVSDGKGFRCITCNRGPPYTKKYAKNQCQTCYKKEKKF